MRSIQAGYRQSTNKRISNLYKVFHLLDICHNLVRNIIAILSQRANFFPGEGEAI